MKNAHVKYWWNCPRTISESNQLTIGMSWDRIPSNQNLGSGQAECCNLFLIAWNHLLIVYSAFEKITRTNIWELNWMFFSIRNKEMSLMEKHLMAKKTIFKMHLANKEKVQLSFVSEALQFLRLRLCKLNFEILSFYNWEIQNWQVLTLPMFKILLFIKLWWR